MYALGIVMGEDHINVSLILGMMVGGYVWGALGDSIGRRSVLINAMIVNALGKF